MRNPLKTLVVGQAEMLRINTLVTGSLVGAGTTLIAAGVVTKDPLFLSLGLSNATIDLAVAFMLGRRVITRRQAIAAAGNKAASIPKPNPPKLRASPRDPV